MPKNQVSDLITDQEITFSRLVLSGTMTDRQAAEAAGLNPDTAAYTKAKPRVRAYMLEHRATMHDRLLQQESEEQRRQNLGRERVLARLWEIADLDPEMTRNSMSAQIKALTMIVAIEGLIPNRNYGSSRRLRPEQISPYTCSPANRYRRLASRATGENHRPSAWPRPCPRRSCVWRSHPPPGEAANAPSHLGSPPAQTLTPAHPFSPAPQAPRKRPRRRLMPPCPLLLQTTGSLPLWKRNPIPGA